MKIKLTGWESEGLRCPDLKVAIGVEGKTPRVFLLQMPNGTGKTTTLEMIRASLSGSARHWTEDDVRRFMRAGDSRGWGKFLLTLEIDGRPLTFELHLDFVQGKASYRTSFPGAGGVSPDWNPPSELLRFLNEEFIHLFVFDGELAEKLLDAKQSEAATAIDALSQLYLLDDVGKFAEAEWQRVTKRPGPKAQTGLTMERTREEALARQLDKVTNKRKLTVARLAEVEKDAKELDNAIGAQIQQLEGDQKRYEQLKLEQQQRQNDVAGATARLMQIVRRPHALHRAFFEGLKELKLNLDRAKLPESSSKQFFVELSQEKMCVCGRPISEHERATIVEHANKYLGEETAGVLNALKRDIDVQVINAEPHASVELLEATNHLKSCMAEWHRARAAHDSHEAALLKKGGDKIQQEKERLIRLEHERKSLSDSLEEIDRPPSLQDTEKTECLMSLRRQLEASRKKIAEISDTVELRRKTDTLKAILMRAKEEARLTLRRVLIEQCNERLARILSRDPVKIKDIGQSIVLHNQEGASVGQTLAVGYTFLASLLHRGQHEFPLIVDSPANPIDAVVRREIGALIPALCDQFIAFTISTEREFFVPALEKAAGGDVKYLTAFRITAGTTELARNLPATGVTKSDNACVVEGRDYFYAFDLETEYEGAQA